MAATRTSRVSVSPLETFIVTVVTKSRGNELSMVNGIRTGFPAAPKVGMSTLSSSTSEADSDCLQPQ